MHVWRLTEGSSLEADEAGTHRGLFQEEREGHGQVLEDVRAKDDHHAVQVHANSCGTKGSGT